MNEQTDLTAAGDKLQSEASRMAEWVLRIRPRLVPYEVRMAALEAQTACDAWTAARTKRDG